MRITKPFYLGKYLVTQEQWEAVMGTNPSDVKGAKNPVETISWDHCQVFLGKLTAKTAGQGGKYVLPTEAQWEYACRAGSTTNFCFGDDEAQLGDYAWYIANSGKIMHPVGEKKPNAWGLYDIHGNAFECCQDWYDEGYYVISPSDDPAGPPTGTLRANRGGMCRVPARRCWSAYRNTAEPGKRFADLSVRVSLVLADTTAELAKLRPAAKAAQEPVVAAVNNPPPAANNPPPAAASPDVPFPASLHKVASFVGPDGKWRLPPGGPSPAIAPFDETKAKELQEAWAKQLALPVEITSGIGMKLVLVPPGEFDMGSPDSDKNASYKERPQHRVRITRPFYLAKYPVTQEQWEAVMGSNPSDFKGPKNPVETVSWDHCEVFLKKLNAKSAVHGGTFVLPTEAQWEYACRAGTTTKYCFGDDEAHLPEYAWYRVNAKDKTHPVGEKMPNPWGFYDMPGNVWEWCRDWYDERVTMRLRRRTIRRGLQAAWLAWIAAAAGTATPGAAGRRTATIGDAGTAATTWVCASVVALVEQGG